jgi:uncharacterized membrane protein
MSPASESDDRRLRLQSALEAAVAEALRRRQVVRWSVLGLVLFVALVIAAAMLFAALP